MNDETPVEAAVNGFLAAVWILLDREPVHDLVKASRKKTCELEIADTQELLCQSFPDLSDQITRLTVAMSIGERDEVLRRYLDLYPRLIAAKERLHSPEVIETVTYEQIATAVEKSTAWVKQQRAEKDFPPPLNPSKKPLRFDWSVVRAFLVRKDPRFSDLPHRLEKTSDTDRPKID